MLKPGVLRKKSDFNNIYNRGKSVPDRYVVIFSRKNHLSYNRTGFLASKKVGNAVHRNRARRLMKESYRLLEGQCGTGYDIIFVARNTINDEKMQGVQKSIRHALKKSGIIEK